MQVPVMDINGKQVRTIDLPADIFEARINTGLMHQAYVRQMAHARLGTHKVQRRHELKLTTAKMYKQKGTGRARHGSRGATQFVGGGRPKGPTPHKYIKDMPKKMRQAAIRSALSVLARDEQLVFVDTLPANASKTKEMAQILNRWAGDGKTLVLIGATNDTIQRSVNNLEKAKTLLANYLNIRDLLHHDKVIVPMEALDVIQQIWGQEK